MPWYEVDLMALRTEFVTMATQEGSNIRELCRRFRISPRTGYKWLARFRAEGVAGLRDRSRRPHTSPTRTPEAVEAAVLALRDQHPAWGARKLHARLHALSQPDLPSPSTLTAILRRHDRLSPSAGASHRAFQRFEHPAPNDLWQMDFKGHFATSAQRCHPLTVLDDHSRFALGLEACADERGTTVQACLTVLFERYGLPTRMLMDNGSPWGSDASHPYTPLTVWLLRLGIRVSHGRPDHPQTQGKDERFHRTLLAEVVRGRAFTDLAQCQYAFDAWRDVYNLERPHQALGHATPASRYHLSPRPFPSTLPPIEYSPDDLVRKVQAGGEITVHGRLCGVGKAFRGYPVGVRPTDQDGVWAVYFCHQQITALDLRAVGPEA